MCKGLLVLNVGSGRAAIWHAWVEVWGEALDIGWEARPPEAILTKHSLALALPPGVERGDLVSEEDRQRNRQMEEAWSEMVAPGFKAETYWAKAPEDVRRLRRLAKSLVREKLLRS